VYLAEDSDQRRIAGLFSFTPVRIRLQGELVTARHGHHLAVRPEYRGGVAFVALSRHAFEVEASHGTRLVIGLLNKKSYGPQKVLMKWKDFGFLDCLRKLSTSVRDHDCREAHSFPADFDAFYGRVSQHLSFHCEKTEEWMNWRFCNRPGAPYRVYVLERMGNLQGYVVLKRWQDPDGYRKAHIVDLHASDQTALHGLLAAAESYAADCDELNLWTIEGYPYREFLQNAGFSVRDPAPQPLAVRTCDDSPVVFPAGGSSFSYGDGDTVY
jgi:hypothetical protein